MKNVGVVFLAICFLGLFYSCKDSSTKAKRKDPVREEVQKKNNHKEAEEKQDPALTARISKGEGIYTQNCAVCHQKNGGGVPNLNPPLQGTDYVTGDKDRLIKFLLQGSSDNPIEVKGSTYTNVMPSFGSLDDAALADVLTYVKNSFGNDSGTVSEEEVQRVRGNMQ